MPKHCKIIIEHGFAVFEEKVVEELENELLQAFKRNSLIIKVERKERCTQGIQPYNKADGSIECTHPKQRE